MIKTGTLAIRVVVVDWQHVQIEYFFDNCVIFANIIWAIEHRGYYKNQAGVDFVFVVVFEKEIEPGNISEYGHLAAVVRLDFLVKPANQQGMTIRNPRHGCHRGFINPRIKIAAW